MFDKNYLGHMFETYILKGSTDYNLHICEKCNVEIYYADYNKTYYFHQEEDILYLTCAETIIKSIIN